MSGFKIDLFLLNKCNQICILLWNLLTSLGDNNEM